MPENDRSFHPKRTLFFVKTTAPFHPRERSFFHALSGSWLLPQGAAREHRFFSNNSLKQDEHRATFNFFLNFVSDQTNSVRLC